MSITFVCPVCWTRWKIVPDHDRHDMMMLCPNCKSPEKGPKVLKKNITYTNFNDEEVTETHHFHLSKADLIELQMSRAGGMDQWLQSIIDSNDGAMIMKEFKWLILRTYGKKSDDGRTFRRTQEIRDEFEGSEAFSTLFVELCTDPEAAAEFVNGVIPKNLEKDFAAMKEKPMESMSAKKARMAVEPSPRVLTRIEMIEMDHDELSHLLATGQAVIGQFGD